MAALLMITVLVTLFGCGIEKTDGNRLQDLEYEIIEDEIPKELAEKIEEKKSADFKLTYENDKYLYIVRGYGEQETGGYSIQILDLYLTQNAVVLHTNLKGPSKDEVKNAAPSYPYIVIRIEHTDKNVIFQ
ncbi:protease complex subunit PrcB family protein [Roseburia sp. BX1005]|uniref:Protease complex subunit PrcB family protein n=2 Tax=Roseburia zhanii TaxID=2763064 RepID=A0A923LP52_9FIRM|nr:protease complex subunit PrcB family protein [Roseburia zhanii]